MKTIILSGGRGYRLKEETEWRPKPMITIGGKPILWHIMKTYSYYGYNDFVLALGYMSDYIKEFFINQEFLNNDFTLNTKTGDKNIHFNSNAQKDKFTITFVDTGLETLPGERIKRLKNYIADDSFMVTYGDGVSDINIKELVEFHKKQKTLGTITGVRFRTSYGMVKIKENNIISEFDEKPILSNWINGGFMVFENRALKFFKNGETEHSALKRLVKKGQLSLYQHQGFWHSMDTYRDFKELNALWEKNAPWKIWTD